MFTFQDKIFMTFIETILIIIACFLSVIIIGNKQIKKKLLLSQTKKKDVKILYYLQRKPQPANLLPYKFFEHPANIVKTILQMGIGVGLVTLVFVKLFYTRQSHINIEQIGYIIDIFKLAKLTVLDIVAKALGYATAVELAYTLFTPGPDEAINPLITGVATVVLLGLGHVDKLDLNQAIAAVLYVLTIAGLFIIRRRFIEKETSKKEEG